MRFKKSRENFEFFIVAGLYGLSIVSVVMYAAIDIARHQVKADTYAARAATPSDALIGHRQ
ncbi:MULTISPECIES: hypothetical protein [Agrobacterium]|jgi:hypothetical protein|uniref:hypothetical protein n=1 Tax=Agrobacterium TaxID=357 RepID=UPI000374C80C|nr:MULTISPECIES: hypothetical protein [Agrobacterium]MBM7324095.1 hypothetical protein [Agrobacterium sp. S2]EPR23506.1 hypothetical protein L902_01430 [Agrobacterium radiobacter DSM 30147]KAB0459350.1 hypothetical protein F7R04_16425 [Agrobacterium tumefaciens]KWT75551.1 hypothetical protein ASH09_19800 [Agrobacterium radiobacter]MDA5641433.1 hypothetical protein [Agrobacterium sp. ST15.13.013]